MAENQQALLIRDMKEDIEQSAKDCFSLSCRIGVGTIKACNKDLKAALKEAGNAVDQNITFLRKFVFC